MKYVIRAAPILVALALFVSFLVVQQDRTAQAALTSVFLTTDPGIADGVQTDPSHVSSNMKVATSGRTVTVSAADDTAVVTPVVTIENDASGDSFTLALTGGVPTVTPWTGTFVVKEPQFDDSPVGHIQAEDGDLILVTVGSLVLQFTVDSDPPNMNEDDLAPGHESISKETVPTLSGKVTDSGSGVGEGDIVLLVNGVAHLAAAVAFTELEDEGGHTFAALKAGLGDGTHTFQTTAIDEAGNAAFSDSDDETDCDVTNTGGTIVNVGGLCEANDFDIDTVDPELLEAFTGLSFDEDDTDLNENDRDWILAFFFDSNDLDGSSVDDEDFLVDGEAPKAVKWFDEDGTVNNDALDGPWPIRQLVFIQLDEDLDADATPDVTLGALAGGVQDAALNINNSDFVDGNADDRIGPLFQVEDFDPPPSSSSLVGDEVEVTFTITSDEATDKKPSVSVEDVFSPGSTLGSTVTSAGTNEWDVVLDELGSDTATIYNVFISGEDESGNASDLGIDNVDAADPDNIRSNNATTAEADGIIDGFFETLTAGGDFVSSISTSTDFLFGASDIDGDAIYFEGDNTDLGDPVTVPADDDSIDIRSPFFVSLDWVAEGSEFAQDDHGDVELLSAELDGDSVCIFSDSEDCDGESMTASSSDGSKWLIAITDIDLGEHELVINASDDAGNELDESEFALDFEVTERAAIEVDLSPGWNLISLPGNPVDPSIDAVMANTPAVEAVITYDPTVPGGFLVALRSEDGGDFSGNLTTMNASRGYWVLTDNFEGIEVDVPPLGTGAGVLPPTVAIAEGWNLTPIQDPTGVFSSGDDLRAANYFTSAEDVSAVYEFDTIGNAWVFIDITDTDFDSVAETCGTAVTVGKSYWVFSTESGTLVPVPISHDATSAEITATEC